MLSKGRMVGLLLLAGAVVLIIRAPERVSGTLRNVFALSNLAIFVFAAVVLAWFVYAVILRRLLRARRIANARMKRMMREATKRANGEG